MSRSSSLALLLSLALGGCVLVPVETDKLGPQVDIWVEAKEYDKALNALAQVDPKHPAYPALAERRKQVEALAAKYEQQVIILARQLTDKGKWGQAQDLYDHGMKQLPDSVTLRDGLAALHKRQQQAVAEQKMKLLLHEARWLDAALPVKEQISTIIPRNNDASADLLKLKESAAEIAEQLVKTGLAALEAKDITLAKECLPLAVRLHDSEETRKASQALDDYTAEQQQQRRQQRDSERKKQAERERRYQKLFASYQQHFSNKRFVQAREQLAELKRQRPRDKRLDTEHKRLEAAIEQSIDERFKAGSDAYSQSRFEEARKHWKAVLELDPKHKKAEENLHRVEKVLENLQRLRERQGG